MYGKFKPPPCGSMYCMNWSKAIRIRDPFTYIYVHVHVHAVNMCASSYMYMYIVCALRLDGIRGLWIVFEQWKAVHAMQYIHVEP